MQLVVVLVFAELDKAIEHLVVRSFVHQNHRCHSTTEREGESEKLNWISAKFIV